MLISIQTHDIGNKVLNFCMLSTFPTNTTNIHDTRCCFCNRTFSHVVNTATWFQVSCEIWRWQNLTHDDTTCDAAACFYDILGTIARFRKLYRYNHIGNTWWIACWNSCVISEFRQCLRMTAADGWECQIIKRYENSKVWSHGDFSWM